MPLIKSSSRKAFVANLKRLLREGYPRRQALAIAYDVQRSAAGRKALRKAAKKRKKNA